MKDSPKADEVVKMLEKYLSNDENTIYFRGDNSGALLFKECVTRNKLLPRDFPDMVAKLDDIVLIIEHFEFDSFKKTKKGSQAKRELAKIEQDISSNKIESGVLHKYDINGVCSCSNYINNCMSAFIDHYSKIDRYKEQLKEEGFINENSVVKTMFFIEDVSPLGSIIHENNKLQPLIIVFCKEFLEELAQSKKLDYVITFSGAGSNDYMWFIDRLCIDEYYKDSYINPKDNFIVMKPHILSVKIEVPDVCL